MIEDVFKALGEPTRLRIIRLLAEKELCVCDLEVIMGISQPRISQHVKILRQAGLITERREGQKRMLTFNRDFFTQVLDDFCLFMNLPLEEVEGFEEEVKRMKKIEGCDTCAIKVKNMRANETCKRRSK
ncbi:metalloregulator ArsR/SmtB family transcription factor [Thermosyntropha sp.]|uniref:ArsR/SmtB family transcription factor n=1 Tax=Thermosyntropha sp. TaxID=2740820 RepID=UPI0025F752D4|nr:metalloregulator ArsR/SmtB family transcription factor [Thermosyntropha sp.]MBO8158173.1 winged helix-turn-helix transcriptional regulator [Thermosyntropha sp.]